MIIVGYGGGTDSTAMLVGLCQRRIPVDLILFSDPGGEQPHTYWYLRVMDHWLRTHDAGAGVSAVKVASLHRVWAQEVLTKVQDRASGQVL